jgi:hypothetical protein
MPAALHPPETRNTEELLFHLFVSVADIPGGTDNNRPSAQPAALPDGHSDQSASEVAAAAFLITVQALLADRL